MKAQCDDKVVEEYCCAMTREAACWKLGFQVDYLDYIYTYFSLFYKNVLHKLGTVSFRLGGTDGEAITQQGQTFSKQTVCESRTHKSLRDDHASANMTETSNIIWE
jgi:hypothetical protein